MVSVLSGSGHRGLLDGPKSFARHQWPTGVVFDDKGSWFMTDFANHAVRKLDPFGIVTTLAGGGEPGFEDGEGRSARFNGPAGVVLDPDGNLLVADTGNFRIRKVTPQGTVSTLAGSGRRGNQEGPALEGEFVYPSGIAVDRDGSVYVADREANRIKRITPEGVLMIIAGTGEPGLEGGTGLLSKFHHPNNIAIDDVGNIYVADLGSHTIRRIDRNYFVTTVAGSGSPGYRDGLGERAQFSGPVGMAFDPEWNLIVVDRDNHRLRRIKLPEGSVTTIAGNGRPGQATGPAPAAEFHFPNGIDSDRMGNLYVADSGNHQIRTVTSGTIKIKQR